MQNENQELESIWADGVPQEVKDEDKVPMKELHAMAVKYVVERCIIPRGFKMEPGFPSIDFPNIVCKKDGQGYAIMVFPSIFPDYVTPLDDFRHKFVAKAKENNLIPLFAPVGYKSIDDARAEARLILKGDVYRTTFPGFIILNDEETQNFQVPIEELFRP